MLHIVYSNTQKITSLLLLLLFSYHWAFSFKKFFLNTLRKRMVTLDNRGFAPWTISSFADFGNLNSNSMYNFSTGPTKNDLIDPSFLLQSVSFNTEKSSANLLKTGMTTNLEFTLDHEIKKPTFTKFQTINLPAMPSTPEWMPDLGVEIKSFDYKEEDDMCFLDPMCRSFETLLTPELSQTDNGFIMPQGNEFDDIAKQPLELENVPYQFQTPELQTVLNDNQKSINALKNDNMSVDTMILSLGFSNNLADQSNLDTLEVTSYPSDDNMNTIESFPIDFDKDYIAKDITTSETKKGRHGVHEYFTNTAKYFSTAFKSRFSPHLVNSDDSNQNMKVKSQKKECTKKKAQHKVLSTVISASPATCDFASATNTSSLDDGFNDLSAKNQSIANSLKINNNSKTKGKKGRPPVHITDEQRLAARRLRNRKYYLGNKEKINEQRKKRKLCKTLLDFSKEVNFEI